MSGNAIIVRIIRLDPMRVARVHAFSESPERDAWTRLEAWAGPRGLLRDLRAHPVYGFNSPAPTPGVRRYGYEFWLRVDADTAAEPGVEIGDFPGGVYAATTCRLRGDPAGTIAEVWMKLWRWAEANGHRWRHTHELERPHDPRAPAGELTLDLLLPVES